MQGPVSPRPALQGGCMAQRIDQAVAERVRRSVRRLGNAGAVDNARKGAEADRRALEALKQLDERMTRPPRG